MVASRNPCGDFNRRGRCAVGRVRRAATRPGRRAGTGVTLPPCKPQPACCPLPSLTPPNASPHSPPSPPPPSLPLQLALQGRLRLRARRFIRLVKRVKSRHRQTPHPAARATGDGGEGPQLARHRAAVRQRGAQGSMRCPARQRRCLLHTQRRLPPLDPSRRAPPALKPRVCPATSPHAHVLLPYPLLH